jgi:hypothetical protein
LYSIVWFVPTSDGPEIVTLTALAFVNGTEYIVARRIIDINSITIDLALIFSP